MFERIFQILFNKILTFGNILFTLQLLTISRSAIGTAFLYGCSVCCINQYIPPQSASTAPCGRSGTCLLTERLNGTISSSQRHNEKKLI